MRREAGGGHWYHVPRFAVSFFSEITKGHSRNWSSSHHNEDYGSVPIPRIGVSHRIDAETHRCPTEKMSPSHHMLGLTQPPRLQELFRNVASVIGEFLQDCLV